MIVTWILLKILDLAGILRISDDVQRAGVDEKMVGEDAYHLWNFDRGTQQ